MPVPRPRQDHSDSVQHGIERRWARLSLCACLAVAACGGNEPEAEVPVAHESPADQILRIGRVWEARDREQGFRTPPSAIAMFSTDVTSQLSFEAGGHGAREKLTFTSSFKLADGSTYTCEARGEVPVETVFGDHAGEAAVEVRRPALGLERHCDHPGFPEPVLAVAARSARFALRGDRLVAFAPATDRREYIPAQ